MSDGLVAGALLLTATSELAMREMFHRVSAQSFMFVALLGSGILLVGVLFVLHRFAAARFRHVTERFILVAAAIIAAGFVVELPGAAGSEGHAGIWLFKWASTGVTVALLAVGAALAFFASDSAWSLTRRAVLVAGVAFVGSQPVLVAIRAPHLRWPPVGADRTAAESDSGRKNVTVFLLLDELNSSAGQALVTVLQAEGLPVRAKAIAPVADGTAKVIPAMFTGRDFGDAKPCSLTATCSGKNVLDFGRIEVSRSDVDVVGFFLPYCAMQGLRYCARSVVAQSALDLGRWRCGAWRRTGFPGSTTSAYCDHVYRQSWLAMTDDVVLSIWRAPLWQRGGFLFAHVPLPHPPGQTEGATLQENYEENLVRARLLVHDIVHKARDELRPDRFRLVIFSDHPLRQHLWCSGQWVYSSRSCEPVASLQDAMVPLIVAGDDLPTIDDIVKNDQIFSLASR